MESASEAGRRRLGQRNCLEGWPKNRHPLTTPPPCPTPSPCSQLIKAGLPVLLWRQPMADTSCVQAGLPGCSREHGGRSGGKQAVQHPQTTAPLSEPRHNWAVVQVQLGPQRKAMLVFSPHNTDITLTDLHMQNCEATGIPPQLTHSL